MLKRRHDRVVLVSPIAADLPAFEDTDWIGLDAGWQKIEEQGRHCLAAVGDFDSGPLPEKAGIEVFRYPKAKDETDAQLAIELAVGMGYSSIVLWGALSGRLDHTLANMRALVWKYPQVAAMDQAHRVSVLLPGSHVISAGYTHISFFAMEPCRITLIGFEYPLDHHPIDQRDFYTCSNSLVESSGEVIVEQGRVLCVESNCR